MMSDKPLVVVTGASGGMGRAIAARLSAEGFALRLTDRAGLDEMARDLPNTQIFAGDLTDPALQDSVFNGLDRLYGLVNAAGIFSPGDFEALQAEDFRRMYEVNVIALFEMSKRAVPLMRLNGGGRIVNIASRAYQGGPRMAHYAASKGAVVSLTNSMAIELGPDQILVNAIAPGVIRTPILNLWDDPKMLAALSRTQAVGRIGEPEDIAAIVSGLMDPKNGFMTGQCLVVDGGRAGVKLD